MFKKKAHTEELARKLEDRESEILQVKKELSALSSKLREKEKELLVARKNIDRLSHRYKVVEGANKKICCLIQTHLKDLADGEYERVYWAIAPELDKEGFYLYLAAKAFTEVDISSYYPTEATLGYFEESRGYELLEWLESAAFGSCDWEPYSSCYEISKNRTINIESKEYQEYRRKIFKQTVNKLLGFDFGEPKGENPNA